MAHAVGRSAAQADGDLAELQLRRSNQTKDQRGSCLIRVKRRHQNKYNRAVSPDEPNTRATCSICLLVASVWLVLFFGSTLSVYGRLWK